MKLADMTIGIVGNGVVGGATARAFLEHAQGVRVYDRVKSRSPSDLVSTLESDLIFLCLPTPPFKDLKDGRDFPKGDLPSNYFLDTLAVDGFFSFTMPERFRTANYVLKSTVPIGTTEYLARYYKLPNLVHSPEFLTARCATMDAQLPTRNIIGIPTRGTFPDCASLLTSVYGERFPSVPIVQVASKVSEAVKIVQNSFAAVKVAFWNEAAELCRGMGIDYDSLLRLILMDGRIHPAHTRVPGPDGLYGFGGTCLPKDLACMIGHQLLAGTMPGVTVAAGIHNTRFRTIADTSPTESILADPLE